MYVFITFIFLLFLNVYCSNVNQKLFYQNKKLSMLDKCLLASDEISQLEVINEESVNDTFSTLGSAKGSRIIVTDLSGMVIYDSENQYVSNYFLLPEVVSALNNNDVFFWKYAEGTILSVAAAPIISHGAITGCVMVAEFDYEQGKLMQTLQVNILQITIVLEMIVILFSLLFSRMFSGRLQRIMNSMRIIQDGDYSHHVNMGGNDELTLLGNEFNDLTERLQISEQKRRRFVSDASHELKTPLASIKLLTDSILQNSMDVDTIREFVGDIGDEAERLNRVASKLLTLTKVDSQEQEPGEIIRMAPTVQRAANRLSGIAAQAGIQIDMVIKDNPPILISDDDFYQIVFNLMENGIKYNIIGGSLTVTVFRENDNGVLSVADTGVGIPADALPHVFERFFRVDKARSRSTGGSGLGLSIVRSIVERNRGEISVTSTMGNGTTFLVSFPAFDTEDDSE